MLARELLKIAKEMIAGFSSIMPIRDRYLIRSVGSYGKNIIKVFENREYGIEVWTYQDMGNTYALGFGGKSQKPDFRYKIRSNQELDRLIKDFQNKYVSRRQDVEMNREKRKETWMENTQKRQDKMSKFLEENKVGDIWFGEINIEKNIVNFYQIIKITPISVVFRKVAPKVYREGDYGSFIVPDKGNFIGSPIMKRMPIKDGKYIKISNSMFIEKWDGKPKWEGE